MSTEPQTELDKPKPLPKLRPRILAPAPAEDEITLRDLVLKLWHGKWIICTSTAVVVALVVAWMKLTDPLYTAVSISTASPLICGGIKDTPSRSAAALATESPNTSPIVAINCTEDTLEMRVSSASPPQVCLTARPYSSKARTRAWSDFAVKAMLRICVSAQADQFLHAHYYQRTFDGRKASYAAFFEQNKNRRGEALAGALEWWRRLPKAPSSEDEMLNVTAPFLRSALAADHLASITYEQFREICMGIHAIKDYARRVPNKDVGLADDGTRYTIPEKVAALSKRIWNDRSSSGARINELIRHVLYGGAGEQLPERLWQAVTDPKWKFDGLGISALGELIGWALPDRFPPRNGRTSKALRSLGHDVTIHVE